MITEINPFNLSDPDDANAHEFPLYYFDSYSNQISSINGHKIVLLYHNNLHATAVFKIKQNKYWRFAQLHTRTFVAW